MLVEDVGSVRRPVAAARERGAIIGVVPTMGALHEGHLSLIRSARQETGYVVVTVFVNPTQFGPNEDFDRYPRTLDDDLTACREHGVDLVFHPSVETVYPDGFSTFVEVEGLSEVLEGAHRPGHFRGVATVVLKLLNMTGPDIAYFGQKDYQQQVLVRKMCRDLDIPVEIRTCPTVREPDGLALSSRNKYLDADQRRSALALSESLKMAEQQLQAGATDVQAVREAMHSHLTSTPRVRLDYATIVHPETLEELSQPLPEMVALVAARVDEVRLIDNIPVRLSAECGAGPRR